MSEAAHTTVRGATANDLELHDAVVDELAWTPEVHHERIGVAVTEGAVTLSGEVASYPEKEAAIDAALQVRGVTAIADEIEVRGGPGSRRRDADIARDVRRALTTNVNVPADVKAEVHDGTVTLTGKATWQYERDAAKRAVAEVLGVRGVLSLVVLQPAGPIANAARARANIRSSFVRNAHIDADQVHVAVSGNKVILTGEVSSWRERVQAGRSAWATPGVEHVENLLLVRDRTDVPAL